MESSLKFEISWEIIIALKLDIFYFAIFKCSWILYLAGHLISDLYVLAWASHRVSLAEFRHSIRCQTGSHPRGFLSKFILSGCTERYNTLTSSTDRDFRLSPSLYYLHPSTPSTILSFSILTGRHPGCRKSTYYLSDDTALL